MNLSEQARKHHGEGVTRGVCVCLSDHPCLFLQLADALEASEARAEAAELRVTAFVNWQAEAQIERNGLLAEREADAARIERLRAVARAALDTPPMAGSPGSPWDRFNEAKTKLLPGDLDGPE